MGGGGGRSRRESLPLAALAANLTIDDESVGRQSGGPCGSMRASTSATDTPLDASLSGILSRKVCLIEYSNIHKNRISAQIYQATVSEMSAGDWLNSLYARLGEGFEK